MALESKAKVLNFSEVFGSSLHQTSVISPNRENLSCVNHQQLARGQMNQVRQQQQYT